jgi:hypothetical protein
VTEAQLRWAQPFPRTGCVLSSPFFAGVFEGDENTRMLGRREKRPNVTQPSPPTTGWVAGSSPVSLVSRYRGRPHSQGRRAGRVARDTGCARPGQALRFDDTDTSSHGDAFRIAGHVFRLDPLREAVPARLRMVRVQKGPPLLDAGLMRSDHDQLHRPRGFAGFVRLDPRLAIPVLDRDWSPISQAKITTIPLAGRLGPLGRSGPGQPRVRQPRAPGRSRRR